MADHVRKQIRDAAVTALTGLATTGTRVFPTRFHPHAEADLPLLAVYTTQEADEPVALGDDPPLDRLVDVVVECVARAAAAVEDTIDTMAAEVEAAMHAAIQSGGLAALVHDGVPLAWEFAFDPEANQELAAGVMTFRLQYATARSDATVAV